MKKNLIILAAFVFLTAIIFIAGCSGAKVYTPPYSKAELERQKIENEQALEQMQNTGQKGLVVGARVITVRF